MTEKTLILTKDQIKELTDSLKVREKAEFMHLRGGVQTDYKDFSMAIDSGKIELRTTVGDSDGGLTARRDMELEEMVQFYQVAAVAAPTSEMTGLLKAETEKTLAAKRRNLEAELGQVGEMEAVLE